MKTIPLFGESINSYSAAVSRQRRLNCFYDIRKDGDKAQVVIRGTPGTLLFTQLPIGPVRGWRNVNDLLYVVSGPYFYVVQEDGTYTQLGVLTVSTSTCAIIDNGVQILIVDGTNGYVYTITTGTYFQTSLNTAGAFGAITDPNFTSLGGPTTAAFIDGYGVVNRPNSQQAYVSESYDFTHWTNSSSIPTFFTKENNSDHLMAVDVLNGSVILWGVSSMEFWQDVGTYPGPFARINGATQTWGLAATYSRAFLNNTIIFLGQNPQGSLQVMMLNGYVPSRVSNSDIENIFSSFTTYEDATSLTYMVDGHPMYQINFPTANRSFMYDSLTTVWSEMQTGTELVGRHIANLGIVWDQSNYVADASTGNIYALGTQYYTDNGATIKRLIASRHIHADGNMLSISQLWLDMETGVGLQTGQGSNPQIMLRVSKDGGRTFPVERWANIGMVGQYLAPRAMWRRLGSSRDFVFEFVMTDPVKFTINKGSVSSESDPEQ